jgi:hypothetical protein
VTILRLDPLAGGSVDRAVATVDAVTLVRRSDGAYADVAEADAGRMVRALALAGVRADASDADLAVPRALFPALGLDLAPLARGVITFDLVRVQRLTLGQSTRELLRRRIGRPSDARAESVRSLLRGEDALLAWMRQAWSPRDALRLRSVRRSLRPIVFDRGALERADLAHRTLASTGALTRWLFA